MNRNLKTLSAAAFAALMVTMAPISVATGADTDPMAEDAAAAGKLNTAVANCNASENDRFQAQQAKFQQEREQNQRILMEYQGQNDAMHRQYDDLRGNYVLLEAQTDEVRKQNQDLQQKYAEMQQKLDEAQKKYDDIVKASQPVQPEDSKKDEGTFHKLLGIIR